MNSEERAAARTIVAVSGVAIPYEIVPSDALYALAEIIADPDHVQCLGSPDQQAACIVEGLAQRGFAIVKRIER